MTLPTTSQLSLLPHRFQVLYALKAAKLVIHLTKSEEAEVAVSTVESWLAGTATAEECKAAAYAAYTANAANAAANAAANTANAAYAAYAAYTANAAARAAAYAAYTANAANAANAAAYAYAADAAYAANAANANVKQQLVDYYSYLATMSERVDNILREG